MTSEPKKKPKDPPKPKATLEDRDKVYKCNPKQRAMACKYLEIGNKEKAYSETYGRNNYSDRAFTQRVKHAFNHPAVVALIKELQSEHVRRHNITVDDLINELEDARMIARSLAEPKTMVAATLGKAQILGLDGKQHDPKFKGPEPSEPVIPVFEVKEPVREVRVKNAKPDPE